MGYTGGRSDRPTYQSVCSGTTGHAEAVEVVYDLRQVSYQHILDVYFALHDPRSDRTHHGGQYRSAVFFHTPEQEAVAKATRDRLQAALGRPLATQIVPASTFWMAEEYHQNYYNKHRFGICPR